MKWRIPGIFITVGLIWSGCGPYLPPTVVPPAALEFAPLQLALQSYVDQTQQFRREAAVQAQAVPYQTTSPEQALEAVRVRERAMATAIRTSVRPGAQIGDVLAPSVAEYLREQIRLAFESPRADLLRDELVEQTEGQEHLYERIAPQGGVRYFVSGGGGRRLYGTRPAEFDDYAESTLHFMVLGIADDRMFFEAIAPDNRLIDCGLLWRTPDAEARGMDAGSRSWLDRCREARLAAPTSSAGSRDH